MKRYCLSLLSFIIAMKYKFSQSFKGLKLEQDEVYGNQILIQLNG